MSSCILLYGFAPILNMKEKKTEVRFLRDFSVEEVHNCYCKLVLLFFGFWCTNTLTVTAYHHLKMHVHAGVY